VQFHYTIIKVGSLVRLTENVNLTVGLCRNIRLIIKKIYINLIYVQIESRYSKLNIIFVSI
jgi:hypothetical protein